MARSSSRSRGGGPRRTSTPSPQSKPAGGWFSSSRPAPAPKHAAPAAAPRATQPVPVASAAPAAPAAAGSPAASGGGGGLMSGMASSMASGLASGVGFGVAQRAVDSVLGPRKTEVVHRQDDAPLPAAAPLAAASSSSGSMCQSQSDELSQCLKRHSDTTLCQNAVEELKQCQAKTG
eukprot:GHVT01064498.1.p1 GENE.GHVT01064498.1~~GHVT01064498.1.p1  ORF type:complete len:177 (+),score=34.24 GHVT01064498.1:620-1150(+)